MRDLEALAAYLGNVTGALASRYGLKDNRNSTLDCLKIVMASPGDYLGVAHALRNDVFELNLVHSTDLFTWTQIATLDTHASQGELHRNPDGSYLVAYEHDEPNSNFIRLRRYANRTALEANRYAAQITLGRTLAPTAEGTPSFDRVTPEEISLRFHYYRNADVDRAARGILRNWQRWQPAPDESINRAIEAFGVQGNIGSRSRFVLNGTPYYLQEGQGAKNDWASWRLYLVEGGEDQDKRKAVAIPMKTHAGSTSFANPAITVLDEPGRIPRLFITAFLPTQGNPEGERGELAYLLDLPR
ncbi:MAG: hypothetical protein OHK0029_14610 [Armatimonadaceae bacterium]